MGQIHSNPKIQLLGNCMELYGIVYHFYWMWWLSISPTNFVHFRQFHSSRVSITGEVCAVLWPIAESCTEDELPAGTAHSTRGRSQEISRRQQSGWQWKFSCFCHVLLRLGSTKPMFGRCSAVRWLFNKAMGCQATCHRWSGFSRPSSPRIRMRKLVMVGRVSMETKLLSGWSMLKYSWVPCTFK